MPPPPVEETWNELNKNKCLWQGFLDDAGRGVGYGKCMKPKSSTQSSPYSKSDSKRGKKSFKRKFDDKPRSSGRKKKPHYSNKRRPERRVEAPVPQGMPVLITVIDHDGDVFGLPENAALVGEYPRLRLKFKRFSGVSAPSVGDVVLVNDPVLDASGYDEITFSAVVVGVPQPEPEPVTFLGEFAVNGDFQFVRPMLKELSGVTFKAEVVPEPVPKVGEIVRAQILPEKHYGSQTYQKGRTAVEILEVLGENPHQLASMVAIENFNIRQDWPEAVLAEVTEFNGALSKAEYAVREDLRQVPIVTIDDVDAKDFDDAVWAEQEGDGFHIIVAIADVAHYVRQDSELDKEAVKRGNSTYFPDMVVPMLPERLSNDLCSLRPNEDRPVLAVHLHIDGKGRLVKFDFSRAVIHSHARLTYEQAQAALDGEKSDVAAPVLESTLKPLYRAYKVLWQARQKRYAIDLDIPESILILDDNGNVEELGVRTRLETHKLIEELMILANVASARALGGKGAPCLYRIHPKPDGKKMETLQSVLKPQGLRLPKQAPTQQDYAKVIDAVRGHSAETMLMKSILQSQMQAKYSTENVGHYGLALPDYAHFTSPIRRYADLTVHRHLIAFVELGGEGGAEIKERVLDGVAERINDAERRSQKAEWEARDRLMTRFFRDFVGETFTATVVTVMKYGCFVSIKNGVAEGLLPMRLMKDDHYVFDAKQNILVGKKTKRILRVGDNLEVVLHEADRLEGRLTFRI